MPDSTAAMLYVAFRVHRRRFVKDQTFQEHLDETECTLYKQWAH
jgi:hypothetical protein